MCTYTQAAHQGTETHAFIITTPSEYDACKSKGDSTDSYRNAQFNGDIWNVTFQHTQIKQTKTPYDWQTELIDSIVAHYESSENNVCSVLITGPSSRGKSEVAGMIAKRLSLVCFSNYDCTVAPKLGKLVSSLGEPAVVCLDEFDTKMRSRDPFKPYAVPDVRNKAGWNGLLDQIQRGVYGKMILIATTNKPLDEFRDQSMINTSRFNVRLSLY